MDRNLFSEEHEQFRQSFKKFVEREILPNQERWREQGIVDREAWRKAGAGGFLCPWLETEHGGPGGDFLCSVVVIEELSKSYESGFAISLHSDIIVPYIHEFGSDAQKKRWLPGCASGDLVTAIAMTEPGTGSDLANIATTAVRDGDDYVLNGQKTFITNGARASFVTLLAKTNPETGSHGCTFFLVPTDVKGFKVGKRLEKIGNHSSDTAELWLEDVRIPERYRLGEEDMGFMYLMQNFQAERLIGAVSGIAGARYAIEFSRQYGEQRVAFGKPIIKREVWQHKFVNMYTKVEMAQAFVDKCVDAYNTDKYEQKGNVSMETVKLISMAKIVAGELVAEVMDTCLQFHGGWGYIEEYPIARAWRDARLLKIGGGTSETMTYYLAKLMGL